MPPPKSSVVGSAKVLNPKVLICLSFTVRRLSLGLAAWLSKQGL
jgi:hypothetical protein